MTLILSAIIGLAAAVLLLTAGYMFGLKRGAQARDRLRSQSLAQEQELVRLREQLSEGHGGQHVRLKATIEEVLAPLIERDKLTYELSHLQTSGLHSGLNDLLDQIADKGNFATVLLSDNEGWPLAASSNAKDLDRLGATTSLLLLVAERMRVGDAPPPFSVMVHEVTNAVTLCRIFQVGEHRLALTAVSPSASLACTALDPALVKVDAALLDRERKGV